jgi:hypothetical protein
MQGMKLLPTGRKSTMYIVLYGSMVGLGTVVLNYFSGLLSTVLMELGFGEDMFSPVCSQTLSEDIRFCELGQFVCGMPAALSGTYYF